MSNKLMPGGSFALLYGEHHIFQAVEGIDSVIKNNLSKLLYNQENNMEKEYIFGIRREDKNEWERRTPFTPEAVKKLKLKHGFLCVAQPSLIRIFGDKEYEEADAVIQEDISKCPIVFGIKEMPVNFFSPFNTYAFFSHTIKGQQYNMPMLKKIIELGCTLIDYELIEDKDGKRNLFFGRPAGIAGMIDSLWAMGARLEIEKINTPFSNINRALEYKSLEKAMESIRCVGEKISKEGLPDSLVPFICGFAGYGNVSKGAQEIYGLLPVEEISPAELNDFMQKKQYSNKKVYKVVFREEDIVAPCDSASAFNLNDYYLHPEKYMSKFENYVPNLTMLINAVYWDKHCPRLVTKKYLEELFTDYPSPRLRVIGDISCDTEGAIECNLASTTPGNPVYIYNPIERTAKNGIAETGIIMLAVDNLPCEIARESSIEFYETFKQFAIPIIKADYSVDFENFNLPEPIKKAVIVYKGNLTPKFDYLKSYL
jgi:alanine dehydrogenase